MVVTNLKGIDLGAIGIPRKVGKDETGPLQKGCRLALGQSEFLAKEKGSPRFSFGFQKGVGLDHSIHEACHRFLEIWWIFLGLDDAEIIRKARRSAELHKEPLRSPIRRIIGNQSALGKRLTEVLRNELGFRQCQTILPLFYFQDGHLGPGVRKRVRFGVDLQKLGRFVLKIDENFLVGFSHFLEGNGDPRRVGSGLGGVEFHHGDLCFLAVGQTHRGGRCNEE